MVAGIAVLASDAKAACCNRVAALSERRNSVLETLPDRLCSVRRNRLARGYGMRGTTMRLPALPTGPVAYIACLVLLQVLVTSFWLGEAGNGVLKLGLLGLVLLFALVLRRSPAPGGLRPIVVPLGRVSAPLALVLITALLTLTGKLTWGHGPVLAGLLLLTLAFLVALWRFGARPGEDAARLLVAAIVALLAIQAVRTIENSAIAAVQTQRLRLDEGRTTLVAARLLWRGADPYASGALVDDTAFGARLQRRIAAGVGPTLPPDAVDAAVQRYLTGLEPQFRRALVPEPPPGASAAATHEVAVLGYKYGPVPLLVTAVLEPGLGAAAVPVGNGLACLALFAVLALALYGAGAGAGLALIALMTDSMLNQYFLFWTATDVWALLFGFSALLFALWRRNAALGVALALALGSKIVPAIFFLPLLVATRSKRAAVAFVVTSAALFLPWVVWDWWGFLNNVFLWPTMMAPVANAWVFYAPAWLVLPARAVLATAMLVLGLRIALLREKRLCSAMAIINVLVVAGASAFWNNYVTWFSTWMVLAIAEAFCLQVPMIDQIGPRRVRANGTAPRGAMPTQERPLPWRRITTTQ
jgi:hypothetical protein